LLALLVVVGPADAGTQSGVPQGFQQIRPRDGRPFIAPSNSQLQVKDKGHHAIYRAAPSQPLEFRILYVPGATPLGKGVGHETVVARLAEVFDHLGVAVEIHSATRGLPRLPNDVPAFGMGHSAGTAMAARRLGPQAKGDIRIGDWAGIHLVVGFKDKLVHLPGNDHSLRHRPDQLRRKYGDWDSRMVADMSRATWEMNVKAGEAIVEFMRQLAGNGSSKSGAGKKANRTRPKIKKPKKKATKKKAKTQKKS
jgi:hypothetical protein